jgi:predicted ATP-dependent endonuclease of OLD family
MILNSIKVENFRSLLNVEFACNKLVALVGPNNVGKSSFLKALRLFYDESAVYEIGDFYNYENEKPLSVTLTFDNLSASERQLTETDDGSLRIKKVMALPATKRNQNYFKINRDEEENELKTIEGLPTLIPIPAVHDAAEDITLKKGTALNEILNLVVKDAFEQNQALVYEQKKYQQKIDEFKDEVIEQLQAELNRTMRRYSPGVDVELKYLSESLELPFPKAEVKVSEDKFASSIDRVGHGQQRAFIMSLLEQLQIQKAPKGLSPSDQTLIISIEEPEIYQHPDRQRFLYKLFERLTANSANGRYNIQIMYSTHSPLFVNINSLENVRRLYKIQNGSKPKVTRVVQKKFDDIAAVHSKALGDKTVESGPEFQYKLVTHVTPWMNEGFFAKKVVLVEGPDDLAAVLGTAMAMNVDLEEGGTSIIPSMGKNRLSRPACVFQQMGIPIYVIWDSDRNTGRDIQTNHLLLKLFNYKPIVDYPNMVTKDFACFEEDLEKTLKHEIGKETYESFMKNACKSCGISRPDDARKSPYVFRELIVEAKKQGKTAATLQQIINNIAKIAE